MTVGGVRIATVTAMHSNGLTPTIGGELGKAMKEAGIAGDVGLLRLRCASAWPGGHLSGDRHHRRHGAGGANHPPSSQS